MTMHFDSHISIFHVLEIRMSYRRPNHDDTTLKKSEQHLSYPLIYFIKNVLCSNVYARKILGSGVTFPGMSQIALRDMAMPDWCSLLTHSADKTRSGKYIEIESDLDIH